jgi:flagellar biosynthesis component FlhA
MASPGSTVARAATAGSSGNPAGKPASSPLAGWFGELPGKLHRASDATLALGVLGMIALMILPVQPWMLDIFLTLNLAAGAVLLMAAVLTPSGARIFTFPTVLILTTLFRLALDVSSTRLILTQAEAGEVIRSFGQFAAGGSVVVGLVVFLIITMVQLIVISKGAEQTANVTAHFVRESIPGRQMAIDADARDKRISPAQVIQARQRMSIEVEFYGRMYGAMQFIKGDSIAGLVVAAINIVGGLIVGVAVNHMAVGDAVETYTLLTVGAGLVSQIPALVGSLAGTILISRVSTEGSDDGLGQTAASQFLALPQAMMLASVMLFVLGVVPGMPTLPFLLLAALLGTAGYQLKQRAAPAQGKAVGLAELPAFAPAMQLELCIHADVLEEVVAETTQLASALLQEYSNLSGIPLPPWSFRRTGRKEAKQFEVRRRGLTIAEADSWSEVEAAVKLDLKLYPAEYFGPNEANRWLEIARTSNEYAATMLATHLGTVQVTTAGDPAPLYSFLLLLVQERVPINHTWMIANALAVPKVPPGKKLKFTDNPDDRLKLAEQVRDELRENSARYYLEQYWEAGSRFVEIGPEAKADLEKQSSDPAALRRLEERICKALADAQGAASIAVVKDRRTELWKITETLFQRKDLSRPVLVLKPSELTETMRALDSGKVVI